ncbi:MAG: Fic family protein, partial [Chitinophagales bacterium]
PNWQKCNTSILDDISASWFKQRTVLKESSLEYGSFLDRLKREHAIETGVIERLYDLKQGITETFIKEGFVKSYLSHGDTDIADGDLMNHLKDHLDAVNFIFDIVKENRPLTTGFIKELHHLVTRHQIHAAGRDQFGNKLQIALLKGMYKVRENNPTRADGTIIMYCPPAQVTSEMDNLVEVYNGLVEKGEHPLVIAAWFHHAFTTIHPFQDGNGRVARLLASLILIKNGFLLFNVLREDAKSKYIKSLGEADKGYPKDLIHYFVEVQRRGMQKGLSIKTKTQLQS